MARTAGAKSLVGNKIWSECPKEEETVGIIFNKDFTRYGYLTAVGIGGVSWFMVCGQDTLATFVGCLARVYGTTAGTSRRLQ